MKNIAVFRTGGKQYVITPGLKVKVEKLVGDPGSSLQFKDVLLVANDGAVKIGTPQVAGASVSATVVRQAKADKVTVVKFKNKVRYLRRRGHRQQFTELLIDKISA